MIKLIDKYIIYHFTTKIISILFAFIIIFLIVDIIDHLDYIIDANMPSGEIIRYYYHTLPWYCNLAIPMSLLLATVFTMGILQKNNELTALKASGISVKRISRSLFILGTLFSIFSFYFENIFVISHLQKRNEIGTKYNMVRSKTNKIKKTDIFRQETNDKILGISKYQFRSKTSHNVSIQMFENGTLVYRLDAPFMRWESKENNWILPKYYTRKWLSDTLLYTESKKDSTLKLNFTPTDLTQSSVKPEEMNYWELKNFVHRLEDYGVKDPRWAINMYFKPAFACTSLLMVLFGLSLSIRRPNSSLTVGLGVSVFIIFLYYASIKTGQSLGYKGTLPPLASVWIPNIIFFLMGIYMFKNTRS